ncbi:Hypothetical predicted protein [Paramuricea clavata]|uniref:Uncharacterized protein n=1 Tax=Paramuricea clavata TaxID=317549 RepID=A0A7D9E7Q3_PARCT|nr:Hypothetical predicted protein [Paramuricea clavata]
MAFTNIYLVVIDPRFQFWSHLPCSQDDFEPLFLGFLLDRGSVFTLLYAHNSTSIRVWGRKLSYYLGLGQPVQWKWHINAYHLESDPHAQLDDVEPINQDQELEDERDDHDTQRDDAGPDEVHTICDPEETQEESAPQTSQASSCDLSQELDIKPSQPKLQKFLINTNFPSKKTRSFNTSWYNRFDWLEYNVQSDAAFCFACKNFGSRSSADTTFTVTGFRKWTNALDKDKGFMKHQK